MMRIRINRYHRLMLVTLMATLAGCSSWQRDNDGLPDVSSIGLRQSGTQWVAVAPDCHKLLQPQRGWGEETRGQIAFGCATYTNLAASLARPQDLVTPRQYSGAEADAAALSVTRYRENKVEPLRQTTSTSKTAK